MKVKNMQSPFKYFLKKHREDIYFYTWVTLTIIDVIYLVMSLVLSVVDKSKGAFFVWWSLVIAFCAFGIFTAVLGYLEDKS